MNVSVSLVSGSPTMSTGSCWMPGLLRHLLAAGSAPLQITLASAPATIMSVYKGLRPLISESRLSRTR